MLFYTLAIQRSQKFFLQTFCLKDSILLRSHLQKQLSFKGKGMTSRITLDSFLYILIELQNNIILLIEVK